MKRKVIPGQQAFNLFPEERKNRHEVLTEEWAFDWLFNVHRCSDSVKPFVHGLFAEFNHDEAFERCKTLATIERLDAWTYQDAIDYFEIYSHEIDYHTVWDRAQAAREGLPKDDVLRVIEWDYRNNAPIFKDNR